MMNINFLILNLIPWNIAFVSFVFDIRFPMIVGQFKVLLELTLDFSLVFLCAEICLIKYWMAFVWKSVRPIDDVFVVTCINIVNTFLSFLITLLRSQFMVPRILTYGIIDSIDTCDHCYTNINFFG